MKEWLIYGIRKTPENRANRTYLIHGDLSLRYGFINKEGKVIVKPKFKDVENFSEGLAAVKNEENKWGYINKEGVYEIEPKFDIAYSFNDGLAPVILDLDNPEYSYIDKKGNVVISPHFGSPSIPSEGLILGSATPGTIVCINYKGEVVFSIKGDSAGYFKDGIAPYSIDRKWGFINREGKIVIEPNFDRVHVFSEGLAAVQVDYKWGFIDKSGRFVVEAEFDSVSDFKDGIAEVFYVKDSIVERYAYIDTKGEFIWKSW